MKTRHSPRRSGTRASGKGSARQRELAVLSRLNHDMRSPLSVIMGVLELLEDANSSLSDGERRYLKLGMKAADELRSLADGLRLYSAMERDLVNLDLGPVELGTMAVLQLESALASKGIGVSSTGLGAARAIADGAYLKVALTSVARHLATHLPEAEPAAFVVTERVDERGCVVVEIAPAGDSAADPREADADEGNRLHEDIGMLNALRLIELMGGRARVMPQGPRAVIELAGAADSR